MSQVGAHWMSGRRRIILVAIAVLLARPVVAGADVRDFLGKRIVDVTVDIAGDAVDERAVLQLIETRVGQPLTVEDVRESIDHLVGVGRFEDVRVFAAASGDGVILRWALVPVQRVSSVAFAGATLNARVLRSELAERFGALPPTTRVADMVAALQVFYQARGYRRASFVSRLDPGAVPEQVTLHLTVTPGPPTLVGVVRVEGDADRDAATVAERLLLTRGRIFDRPAIDARLDAYAESLRDLGYYEARVALTPALSADERTIDVVVTVDRGPLVRVVFAGDPLPANRRDALVPIRQERSVDLDLLEDASRNIESYLRQQGYRLAQAPYVREVRGNEMTLTFTVNRGPLHSLAALEVSGNRAIPTAELQPLLALEPGKPLVDEQLGAVVVAVTELYRVRGFSAVTVKPELSVLASTGTATEDTRRVAVRLVVVEGAMNRVGTVTLSGVSQVPESRVRPLLGLTSGRPFYRPQFDADRAAIERLYQSEGYQSVRVDGETQLADDGVVEIVWRVHEGVRTIVDHVLVTGNIRTDADLIRREVALTAGSPVGDDALIAGQQRLAALGLFRRVRITELAHAGQSGHDILIDVEEAPSTTVSYGGGLEAGRRSRTGDAGQAEERIEIAPRGFLEITRRNLWGKNRAVSLFTRVSLRSRDPAIDAPDPSDTGGYGFNEYRVLATFREPRPFAAAGDLQLTGFIEQAIRSSFNFARRGVRLEYARRASDQLTVSGRYAFDRTRLFDEKIEPDDRLLIDRLFPRVRLSTFTGSLLRDSRNDVLDPERGTVIGVDGTIGARAFGSEVGFAKSFMQAFVYRRLPGAAALTVAAGLRVGLAAGFERQVARVDGAGEPVPGPDGAPIVDTVRELPASERFFAGGDTTVRGFVLDRLGTDETLNDQGFPTGGSGLAVVNVELRTSYWKGLGGVGFLDAGNVFKDAGDLSLSELRPAAGLGVRYRSPLGPLRVDFGFNLNRRVLSSGDRERGMVFHISLGQAF